MAEHISWIHGKKKRKKRRQKNRFDTRWNQPLKWMRRKGYIWKIHCLLCFQGSNHNRHATTRHQDAFWKIR